MTDSANSPLASRIGQPGYKSVLEGHYKRPASNFAGLPLVCLSILVVELCERLAFYTFTGTQEFFLEHLGYTLSQAGGINAAMSTLCMCWALLAGWIADAVLGRYMTILVFGTVYASGAFVACMAAWPGFESSRCYLFGIMVLVPIGTAGIKANISNFGADQYDTSDPVQAAAQEKFFSWFYFSINLGSAVAYGYLTTLGSNGGLGIPKKDGYFAVYLVAALCMVLAICIFRSGRHKYRMQPVHKRSALGAVARYVSVEASSGSKHATILTLGFVLLSSAVVCSVVQAMMPAAPFAGLMTQLAFICAGVGIAAVVLPCLRPSWMSNSALSGETLAGKDVAQFLSLLPVLFSANLAFSCLYNSMQFWYQQQACQMDLRIPFSASGSQFSGSFFMIADCLGIVLATPFAVGWLNPLLEKKSGGRFNHGAKFMVGMGFAAFSVLLAAHMERLRKGAPVLSIASNCAPPGVQMSDMNASWMVVPFFLMGLGEIYTQPVLMHFAYSKCPTSMRTLAVVTCLVIGAVSNALFTVEISALSPFVPNDLNKGNLEYGHYANVVLGGVFCMVYLASLKIFEEGEHAHIEESV
jgi:peptide/histidine transporter 3/4